MTRKFLLIACLSGAASVILGAFGAHLLKKILSADNLQIFETGVRYQFYHTFALMIAAMLGRYLSHKWIGIAGWLFVAGIILFSGSLYILAVDEVLELGGLRPIIGPMTPLGGLLFIAGWVALFRAAFDYKKRSNHSSKSSPE